MPIVRANSTAPVTPPAGPESIELTGKRAISLSGHEPPLELITSGFTVRPWADRFAARSLRYPDIRGAT